jgi:hypothetical protein
MTPERKLRILEIKPKQQYYLQFLTDDQLNPCSEIQLRASEPCVLCTDLDENGEPRTSEGITARCDTMRLS